MNRSAFLCLGIFIALAAIIIPACKMYYTPQKIDYKANADPAQLVEGKRLTMLMCGPCHYDPATKQLSGTRMEDVPGFIGKVYARNITQHPTKGIGNYTDGELAYLLRTGVAKNGKIMQYMQKPNLSEEDMNAVIAFLRSDDELVRSADIESPQTKYTAMGKLGISKFVKPLPYPSKQIPGPGTEKVAIGKYLVDNLSCYECHSKSFTGLDKAVPENSKGYMGGGNKLKDRGGKTVISSNLTFHATGIGGWTEQDFIKAMKQGISKDNSVIAYPMPSFSELREDEVLAIYAYLKTLPPIDNKAKK
jgi:hypothetical protein